MESATAQPMGDWLVTLESFPERKPICVRSEDLWKALRVSNVDIGFIE